MSVPTIRQLAEETALSLFHNCIAPSYATMDQDRAIETVEKALRTLAPTPMDREEMGLRLFNSREANAARIFKGYSAGKWENLTTREREHLMSTAESFAASLSSLREKKGDVVCRMCGEPIVKSGDVWQHRDNQYRHPAQPIEEIIP